MSNENETITNLDESSLSRIKSHVDNNRPLAIVTGFRGELSLADNRARNKAIKQLVRSFGLGFVQVKGAYVEKVDGKPQEVFEESILIIGEPEKGDQLKELAVKIGKKYDQDSILFRSDDGKGMLISTRADSFVGPVGKEQVLDGGGKWSIYKMGDYFTQMKGGRRFIFESADEAVLTKVKSFTEAMAVHQNILKFLKE